MNSYNPIDWPLMPPIFENKFYNANDNFDVFSLKVSALSSDHCHVFFPLDRNMELLFVTALEYMTFNPANKTMNDKFNINPIVCGNIQLFWVSFPKEFKDTCILTAKVFNMNVVHATMTIKGKHTSIDLTSSENILLFKGCDADNIHCDDDLENVIWVGNRLENLGID